jgi:uncharacterized membrane-anchored protein YitT (DUF2179 family)
MKEIKNMFFVTLGSFFVAYATIAFLNPNSMITGGGVGIAQLFYALFPSITLGTWIAIVAMPLILLGMKYFGKGFVVRTVISIIMISFFTDLLKEVLKVQVISSETILASIFGGFLIGLGVGLVILGRASTGGTTIVAEIVAKKSRYKTSQIILWIDGVTMFCSIFVYGEIEKSLFSVIGVYVTSRVVDLLLSGKPAQKAVSIVANNVEVLSQKILENLGEHGTILQGVNLNQKDKRTLILVIVDISKLQLLKEIINEYDPEAFLVIQEASELYGRD